jgi:hypothetical protein
VKTRLVVVDFDGGNPVELPRYRVTNIRWRLNAAEAWTFTINPRDPKVAEIPLGPRALRQVQLWVDDRCVGWGHPWRRDRTTVQCLGDLEHFNHRFLGPVFSFIDSYDGSFELSPGPLPTGWVDGGLDNRGITADFGLSGNHAFVAGCAITPAADQWIAPFFHIDRSYPFRLSVVAYYHIGWNTGYGETHKDRGVYLVLHDYATGDVLDQTNGALDLKEEPLGVWRRTEASINIPAGEFELEVRLYGPAGATLHWDQVDVVLEQRTHSTEDEDASALIRRLVDYCVGNALGGGPSGRDSDYVLKGDLVIYWDPANSTSVGRIGARSYDHGDGASFWSCLKEFFERDLCDFEITYNAGGTQKKFSLFAPRKGTPRPTWTFTKDAGAGNIVDYDYLVDGMQVATQPRVRGRGKGGAENGLAPWDSGDGNYVEAMISPTGDEDINALNGLAAAEKARRGDGVQITWIEVRGATALLAAGLTTGDTIALRIVDDWIDVAATFRVVEIEVANPDADTMKLTLN